MSKARAIAWGTGVALLLTLVLGLFVPNQQLLRVALFWWDGPMLPLWALIAICVAVGALISAGFVGLAWIGERRRRVRSEARAVAIEGEVAELRRLLAREGGHELESGDVQQGEP